MGADKDVAWTDAGEDVVRADAGEDVAWADAGKGEGENMGENKGSEGENKGSEGENKGAAQQGRGHGPARMWAQSKFVHVQNHLLFMVAVCVRDLRHAHQAPVHSARTMHRCKISLYMKGTTAWVVESVESGPSILYARRFRG